MKIGVYGGSFNPCHLVHKEIVVRLLKDYGFERIVLLPTGNFYKKSNLAKGEERIHMLNLMFEDFPSVIICDYEFKNNLICTYRSLDYLQNLYKGDELHFIMGSDNLLQFNTWKRYEYILKNYHLFVILRKDADPKSCLKRYEAYLDHITLVDLDVKGISSSSIRLAIEKKDEKKLQETLDPKVIEYIKKRGLYTKDYQEYKQQRYTSDEEFLKNYHSDNYEKMSITTDITLFSVSDVAKKDYRRKNKKSFSILLVKRDSAPFMGRLCIPGGFLSLDEKLLDSAKRVLFTEANIEDVYLEQFHTFSDIDRDCRGRVLSVSFIGLVDKEKIINALKANASFYDLEVIEEAEDITLKFHKDDEELLAKVKKRVDEYGIISFEEIKNEHFAFDHLKVIATSLEYLKLHIHQKDILYHLLPKQFTLKELQLVHEAILGHSLIDSVFRRSIMDKVIPTKEFKKDGGHRPSRLYQYKS